MGKVDKYMALFRMVGRLPSRIPSSMGYFYSPYLHRLINEELSQQNFDLIFVHCSSVAQYVENIKGIRKIIDFGDMDSQKWLDYASFRKPPLSFGYLLEGRKLERTEKELAKKFDYCTCTTRAELETLRSYKILTESSWFPNGVDHDFFQPNSDPYDPDLISFIGRMDYYPNQEAMYSFCKNVLPLLKKNRPSVKLNIVGANPSKGVLKLGNIPGVYVTGSVPDVRPYVKKSVLTIAPLNIARGTQNKILESLAMGVPVIASERAAGGIDAIPDSHFLVASTPDEYTLAILSLLNSKERRQLFAEAGRSRVLSNHSWNLSMKKLDDIIENVELVSESSYQDDL
jgi:sugar transferase (PEP-CTERM/EpsH1 system associated)